MTVAEAQGWLKDLEPVVLVQTGGDARAYPLQILMWHEIVNDAVDGVPLTITFCPLCNTAIAFKRTLDGRVLDFGTTGRLRFSNLIMYDRQTETWWQQAEGDAIAGELAGRQLTFYPATIISWAEFRDAYGDSQVLSRETGFSRDYGRNPYAGYDDVNQSPFLFSGPATPGALPPMARVLTVDLAGETMAYPYSVLENVRVVNDAVGGRPVAVFWSSGVASALDNGTIALGRDVGSAAAFSPELDGRRLTFRAEGERIVDAETGSEWDLLGRAVTGELAGRQLAGARGQRESFLVLVGGLQAGDASLPTLKCSHVPGTCEVPGTSRSHIVEYQIESGHVVPAITAAQMREVDRIAVEDFGLGLLQMMENAGRDLAGNVMEMLSAVEGRVVVLAGAGGNGGGGIACARHLHNHGFDVAIVLDREAATLTGAPAAQLAILVAAGLAPADPGDAPQLVRRADLVVDALIGYSLAGAPRGRAAELIALCNGSARPVLALDVPSGLDATTGEAPGLVVRPDRTLTLALPKTGLARVPGDLYLADIGIPPEVYARLGIALAPVFGSAYWVRLERPAGAGV